MKKSLSSSKNLSRSIITPFRPLENKMDTAHSQNLYSSLCDDVIRRLQVEVDMLRRQFLVDRQQRTSDMVGMHQKVAELSKQNIQRFNSLKDIFTEIESNIDERLGERETKIEEIENSRVAVQSNIDFLFKKTWELDTSISEILNRQDLMESNSSSNDVQASVFDIKHELEYIKQYLEKSSEAPVKPLDQNFNLRLQGVEEQIKELIYRYQPLLKNQEWIDKIEDESLSINRVLKQHEDQIHSLAFREEGKLEEVYAYIDEQWQKRIEAKLSKIINSYNVNFQELEETNLEIKDILEEVINVNGNLSQKLLTVIGTKLDTSVFKEAISSLSNQFTETLTLNYQKINEIRDKEYEVEHELRSLKEILQKHDLDRNGARSVQRDMDEIISHREKDEPFILSPRHTGRKKLRLGINARTKSNVGWEEEQTM